jgi:hypothetical protein
VKKNNNSSSSSTSIKKKFKKLSTNVKKLKEDSVRLWNDVHAWNSKNDNKLRSFENILLGKLVADLRVIQNEHITQLEINFDE